MTSRLLSLFTRVTNIGCNVKKTPYARRTSVHGRTHLDSQCEAISGIRNTPLHFRLV